MAEANSSHYPQDRGRTGQGGRAEIVNEKFKGTKKVCQEFLVREDGVLAHKLQEEEYDYKYGWNRQERKTARVDVPKARVLQSAEEERIQREAMERLEAQQEIARRDARMAEQVHTQMMLEEQDQRRRSEFEDQELAQKLYEKEQERYERKLRERELARERKRIQRNVERTTNEVMSEYQTEASRPDQQPDHLDTAMENMTVMDKKHEKLLRYDNKVEDLGDFSDFYIQPGDNLTSGQKKELQKIQDEELARLLQEQEHKRGAVVNRDKIKAIEAQDEELARVIQEQEKLRLKKHRQKQAQRQASQPAPPTQKPPLISPDRSRSLNDGYRTGPPRYQDPPDYHDPPLYVNLNQSRLSTGSDDVYQVPVPRHQSAGSPNSGGYSPDVTTDSYLNGYSPPPSSGHSRQYSSEEESRAYRPSNQHERTSPSQHQPAALPASNVITAIDPTFDESTLGSSVSSRGRGLPAQPSPPSSLARPMPPGEESYGSYEEQFNNQPPPGHRSLERQESEGYCELPGDLPGYSVVQGQRRSSTNSKKGKKDKNCKQQ